MSWGVLELVLLNIVGQFDLLCLEHLFQPLGLSFMRRLPPPTQLPRTPPSSFLLLQILHIPQGPART